MKIIIEIILLECKKQNTLMEYFFCSQCLQHDQVETYQFTGILLGRTSLTAGMEEFFHVERCTHRGLFLRILGTGTERRDAKERGTGYP